MFKNGTIGADAALKLLAAQAEQNPGEPGEPGEPANPERVPKRARSPSAEVIPSDDEPVQDTPGAGTDGTTLESLPNICLFAGPGFSNQMCCLQLLV